jgi:ABC-type dipeptide/oligopeptide/nickel transport system permease component
MERKHNKLGIAAMIIGAFICFVLAVILAYYRYSRPKSTLTAVAKVLFYFSLGLFFILLFIAIFKSAPPIPHDKVLPI